MHRETPLLSFLFSSEFSGNFLWKSTQLPENSLGDSGYLTIQLDNYILNLDHFTHPIQGAQCAHPNFCLPLLKEARAKGLLTWTHLFSFMGCFFSL